LNDGTRGLILAVGIVDNSKMSPFTFLVIFWDADSKKICLVPHSSIMKLIHESKMQKPSRELGKLSSVEEEQAISDAIKFLMPETMKGDDAVFYSDHTDTRWCGANLNRHRFSPNCKKGRKTLVVGASESARQLRPTTDRRQSKKAKKAAAGAAATAAPSSSTSIVLHDSNKNSGRGSKRAVPESSSTTSDDPGALLSAFFRAVGSTSEAAQLKANKDATAKQDENTEKLIEAMKKTATVAAEGSAALLEQQKASSAEIKSVLLNQIESQKSMYQQQLENDAATNAQFFELLHANTSGSSGYEAKLRPEAELKRALASVGLERAEKSLRKAGVTSVAILKELSEGDAKVVGLASFQLRALLKPPPPLVNSAVGTRLKGMCSFKPGFLSWMLEQAPSGRSSQSS
jgi:hypothetical protein